MQLLGVTCVLLAVFICLSAATVLRQETYGTVNRASRSLLEVLVVDVAGTIVKNASSLPYEIDVTLGGVSVGSKTGDACKTLLCPVAAGTKFNMTTSVPIGCPLLQIPPLKQGDVKIDVKFQGPEGYSGLVTDIKYNALTQNICFNVGLPNLPLG